MFPEENGCGGHGGHGGGQYYYADDADCIAVPGCGGVAVWVETSLELRGAVPSAVSPGTPDTAE